MTRAGTERKRAAESQVREISKTEITTWAGLSDTIQNGIWIVTLDHEKNVGKAETESDRSTSKELDKSMEKTPEKNDKRNTSLVLQNQNRKWMKMTTRCGHKNKVVVKIGNRNYWPLPCHHMTDWQNDTQYHSALKSLLARVCWMTIGRHYFRRMWISRFYFDDNDTGMRRGWEQNSYKC